MIYKSFFLFSTYSLFALSTLFAQNATQNATTGTLSEDLKIELSQTEDVIADFSEVYFPDEKNAHKFFQSICDNNVTYEMDFATQTVKVILQKNTTTRFWSLEEWNNYLAGKQSRYLKNYLLFRK